MRAGKKLIAVVRIVLRSPVVALSLVAPLLALSGCYNPHVITRQDALYCETQGFRPGSDGNYNCAMKHEDERVAAGGRAEDPPADPSSLPGEPRPPSHPGGVRQVTPYSVAPGKTEMIHFSISVNNDCEFTGMPTIKIERPPTYGTIQVEQRVEFARLAQNGAPASCADKKVSGISIQYTPNKNIVGEDVVRFEVTTGTERTDFRVPITIGHIEDDDDSDD